VTDQSEKLPPQITYRILLVDDDERDCQLLRDILENSVDMSIVGRATDGMEAVALANFYQPDVILMDVNLPSLDGIQATYAIKKTCPRTVIIGVTGHFTPTVYTAMRTAGAAAFVSKCELLGIHETILGTLEHSINNPGLR
jgi:DNA-binding NarL/FixJ family response regulator